MKVVLYHNPRCSKSRQTLDLIREAGYEPDIIEYLKTRPGSAHLEAIMASLQITDPRQMMRTKEVYYKEHDLDNPAYTPAQLLQAVSAQPALLERPVVITDKGARICRPPELVKEIL